MQNGMTVQPLRVQDVKFFVEYYRDNDPQAGWMRKSSSRGVVDDNRVTLVLSPPILESLPNS
jgi:hypothetical protein